MTQNREAAATATGASAVPGLFRGTCRYTRSDRLALLFSHFLAASTSALGVTFPLIIGMLMNEIQRNGVADLHALFPALLMLAGLLTFIWTVRVPLKLLQFGIARRAQNAMIADLNQRLFSAPLSWHEHRHSGDTASRVQQSSAALFNFSFGSYAVIEFIIQIVGPIIALALLSPPVLVGAVIGFVILGAISVGADKFHMPFWVREIDVNRRFNTVLVDGYRNVMTMYATRRRHAFAGFIGERLGEIYAIARKSVTISESKRAAIEVISTVFNLSLVVLYIYLEISGDGGSANHVALGNIYMVQAYVMSGTAAMLGLVAKVSEIMQQRADFSTSAPIYEAEPEPESDARIPDDWSTLDVRKLMLTYRGKDHATPALKSVDLTLQRGRHYALVGANGSGKSTLLKLLAGLLGPDDGELLVDGTALDFGALRHSATLIPQHPELLEGTLEHNLLIGASDGTVADAIAQSNVVSSLLDRLGVRLEYHVQEAGVNWSGGQRQRIALARGILSAIGSSIVLVDEPTSSIDPADERSIIDELRVEFEAACVVISVHNLELVRNFDAVIVLDNGVVQDAGSPEAVWQRCSYFEASDSDCGELHGSDA